ncbi:hypothetical protein BC828DRAFT_386779 [Blastocladiella britannica]|nr:hypothetical protein BC828DRAFT_386779 [Blastocladiella britannica]
MTRMSTWTWSRPLATCTAPRRVRTTRTRTKRLRSIGGVDDVGGRGDSAPLRAGGSGAGGVGGNGGVGSDNGKGPRIAIPSRHQHQHRRRDSSSDGNGSDDSDPDPATPTDTHATPLLSVSAAVSVLGLTVPVYCPPGDPSVLAVDLTSPTTPTPAALRTAFAAVVDLADEVLHCAHIVVMCLRRDEAMVRSLEFLGCEVAGSNTDCTTGSSLLPGVLIPDHVVLLTCAL